MSLNREQLVATIVEEVLARLPKAGVPAVRSAKGGTGGAFESVDEAVSAATEAQKKVAALGLEERGLIVDVIRNLCTENAEEWGRAELEETKIGRLDHKIEKLRFIRKVLGVEVMRAEVRTDRAGASIIEAAPWGVVAMALPATHSAPTMASNAVNVLAAGNVPVFTAHPAAAKIAARALQAMNRGIEKAVGIENALVTVFPPSIEATQALFRHPGVALICVTGGPAVVKAAMQAGKRVIAAGPGNPPVVVDPCADLALAARHVVDGASFDNNLLCISEKELFVAEEVADDFMAALRRCGAVALDARQIDALTKAAFTFDGDGAGCGRAHVKRDFVGKDPSVLAEAAGARVPATTQLLFGETGEDHPFVQEEQMMPFVPVVRVRGFERAVEASLRAEHGYRHTALIHTSNLRHVTEMARAMNTTLFVHNGPCTAALGSGGAGYLSYSIATPTGEGVTTPLTFTRQRQLSIGGALRFI